MVCSNDLVNINSSGHYIVARFKLIGNGTVTSPTTGRLMASYPWWRTPLTLFNSLKWNRSSFSLSLAEEPAGVSSSTEDTSSK